METERYHRSICARNSLVSRLYFELRLSDPPKSGFSRACQCSRYYDRTKGRGLCLQCDLLLRCPDVRSARSNGMHEEYKGCSLSFKAQADRRFSSSPPFDVLFISPSALNFMTSSCYSSLNPINDPVHFWLCCSYSRVFLSHSVINPGPNMICTDRSSVVPQRDFINMQP